ncbi:MAG: transglutaminase domain-containing protein, partial [Candidatus Omnitrophota bacterium]
LSLPNTLDVLEIKEGDCGELSALLVGFLRSVGIPSYVNIGLVYNKGKFFYHAWPSVFVGEWIDTDPAFNQLIADPTHIKLLKGLESQFQISKIIGNVKIEILEYK